MAGDDISARVVLEGGKEVTKELQGIGKEADKLDGTKIKVPVESDTKKARKDIEGLFEQVDKLGKFSGGIVLKDNAKDIKRSIADLVIELDQLDANDPEVDIKVGQINALESDLDQIQTRIKSINSVPIDLDTRRAKTGIDEVGKSADSSKSVLANMVGNTTQDLGNLGGIAGSTGVAIGQIGEYAADAISGGEGLASVLSSFTTVALPIAAISVGIGLITKAVTDYQKREAEAKAQIKATSDALLEQLGITDKLTDSYKDSETAIGQLIDTMDDKQISKIAGALGTLGANFGDLDPVLTNMAANADATIASLLRIGGLPEEFIGPISKIIAKEETWKDVDFRIAQQFDKSTEKRIEGYSDLIKAAEQVQDTQEDLLNADVAKKFLVTAAAADEASQKIVANAIATSKNKDSEIDWVAAMTKAIPAIKQHDDAVEAGRKKAAEASEAANDQLDENIKKIEEWRDTNLKAQQDVTEALDNITEQWRAMSDEISEQSFADALDQFDSLSELDLSQVRQDTVSSFDDVKEAIKTAAGEVKGWGKMDLTPDSFEELKGMPAAFADITDAVSGMRGSIQTELKAAFDTGGVQAFSEKFDFFAGQVRQQFTDLFRNMGLPEDQVQAQVQRILGDLSLLPESKTILIKLTREQELKNALDAMKAQIDAIEQANPSIDISAKIAEGDIEGAYDELNALRISEGKEPIVLPTDAEQLGAATAAANARTRAQNYLTAHPAIVPVGADGRNVPNDTMRARNSGQDTANANPIRIPVFVQTIDIGGGQFRRGQVIVSDAGGTIPPGAAGLVAEKRPEIINGRYLVTQPTVVPSGTRVTSGARTARILRRRGTRGLKGYDRGGTVAAGPSTVNVNFNGVGAIGSRYDLMRTVKRANLDRVRLLGTRG